MRIDPPVSVPRPAAVTLEATHAADPQEEPPVMRSASIGCGICGVMTPQTISWVALLPTQTAPAC